MNTIEPLKKKTILVTGSGGMIGWHLSVFLDAQSDTVNLIRCDRARFNDDTFLADAVSKSDVIVHLAGMNRGDEDEIVTANIGMADRLIKFCRSSDVKPHVIYSSSTHVDGPTRYGYSKRTAGEHFEAWAADTGSHFCNLVLPHVFGELGKPFYNSVVSTFASQIVKGESPTVTGDGDLNLLHSHEVSKLIWDKIATGFSGTCRPEGLPIKVSQLLERLQSLWARYQGGVMPNFDDLFDVRLFNVMRSYLDHEQRRIDLTLHEDNRGDLFEAVRADGRAQVFVSTTKPGITRGNHFHFRKVERFLVFSGKAKIRLRKVLTDEIFTYEVSGDQLQAIDIPTLHTHNITNVGDEPLLTLFWTNEHYDPADSDTFFLPVEPVEAEPKKA